MKYLIIGGAGFIGSYIAEALIKNKKNHITIYDNFSSGKLWHLEAISSNKRLKIINKDIYNKSIYKIMTNINIVILLAANPDISKAVNEPDIDFKQGTVLTQIVLESMRLAKVSRLIYASGSGVYGDIGNKRLDENYSPMQPISTYGASKLACEALISSYSYMFDIKASALRFGNVVGGRQTHGVGYDFIRKLINNPYTISVMGNGSQSKPYIHVDDVVRAIILVLNKQKLKFDTYNVAPDDILSVSKILDIVLLKLKINKTKCDIKYEISDRGWKGDVPIVKLSSKKISKLGWKLKYNSLQAVTKSIRELYKNRKKLY